MDKDLWPIYSFTAKWDEGSKEFQSAHLESPVDLPEDQAERVERVCRNAYRLAGLRDYGRVDIRLTPEGQPYILEVNPNPYLNSIVLIRGLEAMGRSLPRMVETCIWAALARGPKGNDTNWLRRRRKSPTACTPDRSSPEGG
jgi:D-alanine-D-alanine ligase